MPIGAGRQILEVQVGVLAAGGKRFAQIRFQVVFGDAESLGEKTLRIAHNLRLSGPAKRELSCGRRTCLHVKELLTRGIDPIFTKRTQRSKEPSYSRNDAAPRLTQMALAYRFTS